VTDTSGLKLKVVFRTLQDVLARKRTDLKPTTVWYLSSAEDIFSHTADAMDAIADRKLPSTSDSDAAQHFFFSHSEIFATASRTNGGEIPNDPEQLHQCAAVFREFAAYVNEIKTKRGDAYKPGDFRMESLKSFADAVVNTASKSEPTVNNIETVVTL
jgi:hypothetical protein